MGANDFDLVILGSGMSGSILGSIIARHGYRVLILESGTHPRFTIGESSVPETSMLFRIVAERYNVPELKNITSFYRVSRHISSACGIKRNFGFAFHREGMEQDPREITQCIVPELPFGPESHFFRQDVDAYLLYVAIRYGAVVKQQTKATEIKFGEGGVEIKTAAGESFTGRYIVDCGGLRAPLSVMLGLGEQPTRFKTHSRSLFTHMIGVRPFDECFRMQGQRWLWHEGTLHHIFDGGWMWVIPFDNHPRSTNPLCSVGLQLDPRRFPKTDLPPAEEFAAFLARYPTIAAQFRGARPVRDWTATDRLQFSSTRCVGDRYCMMLHATGFIDPLFSRGLQNTAATINALGWRLLRAFKDGDFSAERFAFIERLEQTLLDENDRLVNGCYTAFSDFRLWDGYHRMWAIGTLLGNLRMNTALQEYRRTGDIEHIDRMEQAPHLGMFCADLDAYEKLVVSASADVEAVAEKRMSSGEAAERIMRYLTETSFADKIFDFGFCMSASSSRINQSKYNMLPLVLFTAWGKTQAPEELRRRFFDVGIGAMLKEIKHYVRYRI